MHWLQAHDSNNNGLIELPESSDWMDLFPRSYNVLYDEVLWYLACRDFSMVTRVLGNDPRSYEELTERSYRKQKSHSRKNSLPWATHNICWPKLAPLIFPGAVMYMPICWRLWLACSMKKGSINYFTFYGALA